MRRITDMVPAGATRFHPRDSFLIHRSCRQPVVCCMTLFRRRDILTGTTPAGSALDSSAAGVAGGRPQAYRRAAVKIDPPLKDHLRLALNLDLQLLLTAAQVNSGLPARRRLRLAEHSGIQRHWQDQHAGAAGVSRCCRRMAGCAGGLQFGRSSARDAGGSGISCRRLITVVLNSGAGRKKLYDGNLRYMRSSPLQQRR